MRSADGVDKNIEAIAVLFPNVVSEVLRDGKVERVIDFDVLRQELSKSIVEGAEERYQFTWPEKKKSVLLANKSNSGTLRPCRGESVNFNTTENLYIEGDNLDVLKLLQETYLGKVKMIYIDPPYNTGKDFIYPDKFKTENYDDVSGDYDEDGYRLVQNLETNGQYHTDWLNMIYPRLRLAKDLLRDDGVIFISIDDHEAHNLRKICDEIFGAWNFVAQIVWKTKNEAKGIPPRNMHISNVEYVIAYQKNSEFSFLGDERKVEDGFSNPDNDPRGAWKRQYLQRFGQGFKERTIVNPENGMKFTFETPYTDEKMNLWIREERIIFPEDNNKYPARKEFFSEYDNPYKPIVSDFGLYNTKVNSEKLNELFDDVKIFDFSKPLQFLYDLLNRTVANDAIILDFFSGSATTAHAVMQLNAEDGGNRKFIMVQIPEECKAESEAAKAGYKNICEIGKERVRRAGAKINAEIVEQNRQQKLDGIEKKLPDIGFRVLRLDSSNMRDVYYTPGEIKQSQLEMFTNNIKDDRTPEDLLFQVMLNLGVLLSSKIDAENIGGKKVFVVYQGETPYLMACFDDDITSKVVTAIAKRQPYYAVFRDSGMGSDSLMTSFDQIFETYSKNTDRKVL